MSLDSLTDYHKPVEKMIVDVIVRRIRPQRIILFGSRARDDANPRSDYDVAIDDERLTPVVLAQIRASIETIPTLLHIDVVGMNRISAAFRQRILNSGRVLYEQQS